jgi:hypothetical protein
LSGEAKTIEAGDIEKELAPADSETALVESSKSSALSAKSRRTWRRNQVKNILMYISSRLATGDRSGKKYFCLPA